MVAGRGGRMRGVRDSSWPEISSWPTLRKYRWREASLPTHAHSIRPLKPCPSRSTPPWQFF